jgi:aryl-alcohol dehydrogenase-like predicted oxidoreductase
VGTGHRAAELAVASTLAHPAVDVAIVRARRPYQVDGTAAGADLLLSPAELGELDAILAHAMPMRASRPEGM